MVTSTRLFIWNLVDCVGCSVWQLLEHPSPFVVLPSSHCSPVSTVLLPHIADGVYVQLCVVTGLPPVHPDGLDDVTVLDCVLFDWHVPYVLYVNEAQVTVAHTPQSPEHVLHVSVPLQLLSPQ